MKVSMLLCAMTMAMSLTVSARAGDQAPGDCRLKLLASLDVKITSAHQVLVPVTLDGESYEMRLNLASFTSVIVQSVVDKRKMPVVGLPADGVYSGGHRVTQVAHVAGLGLGAVRFKQVDLLVGEDPKNPTDDAIGGIGINMFGNVDVELDASRKKLNLFSQDHCPGQVVYWSSNYSEASMERGKFGNVYFPMELEGKKVAAMLWTEGADSSLTTDVTSRLFGFDTHSGGIETKVDESGKSVSSFRAMALTSNGLTVTNTRIKLLPERRDCHVAFDGYGKDREAIYDTGCGGIVPLRLGMNVIEKLRIYIATKENVLYFTTADAHQESAKP